MNSPQQNSSVKEDTSLNSKVEPHGPTPPYRPPSAQSTQSSHSSGSSSKHVKCIGRYVLTGHNLGKGNFARVESAVHTLTRAKVAIKIIETDKIKEEYVRRNLLREAQLMRRLRHPNIIRLYETMKTNNLYCLVTEIAEGGELLSFVRNDFKEKRLPEATTRPFIRQLTSALFYLHSHGIVHRDLKMENILLDKKKRHVKIVDFGLSNAQKAGALLQTHCGSPEYAAPELFIPGRQYGPEVDVWSLGVNMYAMLVGKLPFRSPRQGTKKRQKLLEQITGGITEAHEKEMAHVSTGARVLICHLLQPDSSKRATLDEVMHHPWSTKDGSQPLVPYEYTPPDPITQNMVMELMQKVLGEPVSQIKETVRRDRCDWLAAIYNLLMDQPEGRNILQRMLTNDPTDNLTSATDYQSTTEHLSLSQGLQSHQSQEMQDSIDPTGILYKPIFPIKQEHRRSREETAEDALLHNKMERRKHPTADQRTLGQLRGHGMYYPQMCGAHQSAQSHKRYSKEFSPNHVIGQVAEGASKRHLRPSHEDWFYPGTLSEPSSRPHSRLSAPEPLPIPFQKSFLPKSQQYNNSSPIGYSPSGSPPSQSKFPVDVSSQESSPHNIKGSKRHSALKPMRDYSNQWKKGQVAPLQRQLSTEGWSSNTHKVELLGETDGDTEATILMSNNRGLSETAELHPELALTNGMTKTVAISPNNETTADVFKTDMLPKEDIKLYRSTSAKHYPPQNSLHGNHEMSISAKHLGELPQSKNGLRVLPTHKELPHIESLPNSAVKGEKISPSVRRKSIGGFFGKAFKSKSSSTSREERTIITPSLNETT